MKDFFQNIDVERQKEIDNCVSKLRNCLGIIRGKVEVQDYSGIFFLMHLKNIELLSILKEVISEPPLFAFLGKQNSGERIRDEFLSRVPSSSKLKLPITVCDNFFNNPIIEYRYKTVYGAGVGKMSLIKNGELVIRFIDAILAIKELENQDIYADIFDGLLYDLTNQKRSFSDALLLEEVSWYVTFISRLHNPNSVYNPFAGFCSFNIFSDHKAKYFGQEINEDTVAIGMLRLMANKCDPKQLQRSDSMFEWNPQKKKYDLIIFNPPFFNGVDERNKLLINLSNSLEDLSDNGKLFCVMPIKLLSDRRSNRFVRSLVDQDLVESIISLPHNSYYNTSIDSAVIIISKSKQLKGSINFCKLDSWFDNKKRYTKGARTQSFVKNLPKDFPSNYVNEESSIIISNKELKREYDYDLSVGNKLVKKFKGVRIGELLDNYRERGEYKTNDYFIKIADLSSNIKSFELELDKMRSLDNDPKSLDQTILGAHSGRANRRFVCLKEDVLLIANRHLNLKPSYYKNSDKDVFLSPNVSAYKIDKKKILPEFLINELNSDDVIKQLELLRSGSVIPSISNNDFLNLRINLPPLNQQQGIVSVLREKSRKIDEANKYIKELEDGNIKDIYLTKSTLSHDTGLLRDSIYNNIQSLKNYFSKDFKSIKSCKNDFKKIYNEELDVIILELEKAFNSLNARVHNNGRKVLNLRDENLLDIINFIKKIRIPNPKFDLIHTHPEHKVKASESYSFATNEVVKNNKVDAERILTKEELDTTFFDWYNISIDIDYLKEIIENILINANKHAFKSKEKNNKVIIELDNDGNELIMIIKDNGIGFPKGFTKEKFIQEYATSDDTKGSGIGGNTIDNNIKELRGNWDLDLDNIIFPVIFTIKFPVKYLHSEF